MPIQYKDSIMESTQHCRQHASLFDVAHMCGLTLKVGVRHTGIPRTGRGLWQVASCPGNAGHKRAGSVHEMPSVHLTTTGMHGTCGDSSAHLRSATPQKDT